MSAGSRLGISLVLLLFAACAGPGGAAPASRRLCPATRRGRWYGTSASSPSATAGTQASGFASARLPSMTTIKFGYTPFLSGSPVFLAIERGYFEQLNLNLDMIRFNSGALMVAPLASNDLTPATVGCRRGCTTR